MRPPIKWHGGKHYLARRIVALFPEHRVYVEPFGGAASVLLAKEPSEVEVWNDIDRELYNFFRVLQSSSASLRRHLTVTPYHKLEFKSRRQGHTSIRRAARFYTQCRQSIGGRREAFSQTVQRSRRGMADVVSGWLSSIDENMPTVVERLRRVQFLCDDWEEVIAKYDSLETLFYCDPPYLPETRASPEAYTHEMTKERHQELLAALNKSSAMVVLSGYPSSLYNRALRRRHGWRKYMFDMPNNAASGKIKKRKKECVWIRR